MLSFVGMCFTLIFGTLLTANGSLRFLNIFSFVGIIINVSLNFYLIPIYGATGSAFATFATQSSIALIQFAYCAKNFEFQFSFKLISRYALFLILTVAVFYFFSKINTSILVLLSEILCCTVILFLTKMIDVRSLKKQFLD